MENNFQFLIYRSAEEDIAVDAIVKDESIWLSQQGMGELFGVQKPAISKHLKKNFEEGELDEKVVVSKMETTTHHGALEDKTQDVYKRQMWFTSLWLAPSCGRIEAPEGR